MRAKPKYLILIFLMLLVTGANGVSAQTETVRKIVRRSGWPIPSIKKDQTPKVYKRSLNGIGFTQNRYLVSPGQESEVKFYSIFRQNELYESIEMVDLVSISTLICADKLFAYEMEYAQFSESSEGREYFGQTTKFALLDSDGDGLFETRLYLPLSGLTEVPFWVWPTNASSEDPDVPKLSVEIDAEQQITKDRSPLIIKIKIKNLSSDPVKIYMASFDLFKADDKPDFSTSYWAPQLTRYTKFNCSICTKDELIIAKGETITTEVNIFDLKWGPGIVSYYPAQNFHDVVKNGKYTLSLNVVGHAPGNSKNISKQFISYPIGLIVESGLEN